MVRWREENIRQRRGIGQIEDLCSLKIIKSKLWIYELKFYNLLCYPSTLGLDVTSPDPICEVKDSRHYSERWKALSTLKDLPEPRIEVTGTETNRFPVRILFSTFKGFARMSDNFSVTAIRPGA
jgi:hypothetical protein